MIAALTSEVGFWVVVPVMVAILGCMVYMTIRCRGLTGVFLGGPVSAEFGSVQSWPRRGKFRVVVATTREGKVVGLAVSQRGILSYDSTAFPLTPCDARELAATLRQKADPQPVQ